MRAMQCFCPEILKWYFYRVRYFTRGFISYLPFVRINYNSKHYFHSINKGVEASHGKGAEIQLVHHLSSFWYLRTMSKAYE